MAKHNFRVLSNVKCIICGTRLKQNLIDAKPNANMCYKHYQMIVRRKQGLELDYHAKLYLKSKRI